MKEMFCDNGKSSITKIMVIIAFLVTTYILIENRFNPNIAELLFIYLGLPYANRQTSRYVDIIKTKTEKGN